VQAARIVFPAADRDEIAAATVEILRTGALTLGPYTRQFEAAFAAAHSGPAGNESQVPRAVAVSSGTASLEIILRSIGVAGRDVVVPANTFFATAEAAIRAGGRPVFADIDPQTFALSPQTVIAALTPGTAAVVLVHIGGLISPDAAALRRVCDERGIALVEDAAHAHGSTYRGQPAGSFGTAAGFSFFPTKVVTSGEGGMIITADAGLESEARIYRDQGKGSVSANHHVLHGYAWRMTEQAAVTGLVHLRRLGEFIERRREVAARYDELLAGLAGIEPLAEPDGCRGNYYKYIAVLPPGADRARFRKRLKEEHGVSLAGEVYDLPLHQQPVFAEFAARQADVDQSGPTLPVTEDLCARHICLPVHSDMTADEIDQVCAAVAAAYECLAGV
jgi:dTDP-4-amino-4,6-dideoxygalactose transaminase